MPIPCCTPAPLPPGAAMPAPAAPQAPLPRDAAMPVPCCAAALPSAPPAPASSRPPATASTTSRRPPAAKPSHLALYHAQPPDLTFLAHSLRIAHNTVTRRPASVLYPSPLVPPPPNTITPRPSRLPLGSSPPRPSRLPLTPSPPGPRPASVNPLSPARLTSIPPAPPCRDLRARIPVCPQAPPPGRRVRTAHDRLALMPRSLQ